MWKWGRRFLSVFYDPVKCSLRMCDQGFFSFSNLKNVWLRPAFCAWAAGRAQAEQSVHITNSYRSVIVWFQLLACLVPPFLWAGLVSTSSFICANVKAIKRSAQLRQGADSHCFLHASAKCTYESSCKGWQGIVPPWAVCVSSARQSWRWRESLHFVCEFAFCTVAVCVRTSLLKRLKQLLRKEDGD